MEVWEPFIGGLLAQSADHGGCERKSQGTNNLRFQNQDLGQPCGRKFTELDQFTGWKVRLFCRRRIGTKYSAHPSRRPQGGDRHQSEGFHPGSNFGAPQVRMAPDGSPTLTRAVDSEEIYALSVRLP